MKLKGLLLNDFYTLKDQYVSYIKLLIPCLILMGAVNISSQVSALSDFSYMIVVFMVLPMSMMMALFTYEEKCGYMQYALTMPVTRKKYVCEKYVFYLLNTAAVILAGAVLIPVFALISGHAPDRSDLFWLVGFSLVEFLVSSIFGVWVIALNMKFSTGSARIVLILGSVIMMIIVTGGTALGIMTSADDADWNVPAFWGLVGFGVLVLILTVWMFCMSFRWAERKEL